MANFGDFSRYGFLCKHDYRRGRGDHDTTSATSGSALVNWLEIGAGSWPDNAAFDALTPDEQLREIRAAARLAAEHQFSQPQSGERIAAAALRLMDGYGLDDAHWRAWLRYLIAGCTVNLGDKDKGGVLLRALISGSAVPETAEARKAAMLLYAGILGEAEPDNAIVMLRDVISMPEGIGSELKAPRSSAAVSLGALLRRTGHFDEARRVFETAIREQEEVDHPPVELLARLHGNLGNLCYELGKYANAAEYFAKSVAFFDAGSESGNAARRFFHLVDSRLKCGDYEMALCLLSESENRRVENPGGYCEVIAEADWLGASDLEAWEEFFAAPAERHASDLADAEEALVVAARILLRHRLGDDFGALRLVHERRLSGLPLTPLMRLLWEALGDLAESHDCPGTMWPLLLLADSVDHPGIDRQAAKFRFATETATIWLFEMARLALRRDWTDDALIRDIWGPNVVHGIGSVAAELPAWLGPASEDITAQFTRLRGLYPSMDKIYSIQVLDPTIASAATARTS
jgi:tetratricopeptide (TPR) repeat protein